MIIVPPSSIDSDQVIDRNTQNQKKKLILSQLEKEKRLFLCLWSGHFDKQVKMMLNTASPSCYSSKVQHLSKSRGKLPASFRLLRPKGKAREKKKFFGV